MNSGIIVGIVLLVLGVIVYFIVRSTYEKGQGSIDLRVTDKAPEGIKSLFITASRVRVKQGTDDDGSGWIDLVTDPVTFDLVAVVDIEKSLGITKLPAGHYGQLRMDIVKAIAVNDSDEEIVVTVPSSSLRLVSGFKVPTEGSVVLTLDFDANASLIETGPGKLIFKPVLQLLSRSPQIPFDNTQTF
jgi:hypothetical protein